MQLRTWQTLRVRGLLYGVALVWIAVSLPVTGVRPRFAFAEAKTQVRSAEEATQSPARPREKEAASAKVAEKVRKRLVGRWELVGERDVLEFRSDGTFSGQSAHAQINGRYEITPFGELLIDLGLPLYTGKPKTGVTPGTGQEATATPARLTAKIRRQVRFEKDTLILKDQQTGDSFRYRRVR